MKRKILQSILLIAVILVASLATFGIERAIVPDMNFVGEAIKLSLGDAVKIMQTTGSRAETATLNKAADEAVAKGHKESVQSISELLNKLSGLSLIETSMMGGDVVSDVDEKIMKMRRDFAKVQVDANYQAELNEIEATTVQMYYGILLAEENLKISKDNLSNQKSIYNNTLKKYRLGTVAKIDTLMAETQVTIAEDQVALAETDLKKAKMGLNLLLGNDLMQEIKLTDKLKIVDIPEGSLTDLIESALDNRNEIKGTRLSADIQEILLTSLNYRYPKNSSTYLTQEAATLQARKATEDAPIQIEMDIRGRYMDILDKQRGVDVAESSLENAKEGYRLAVISYDAGINTLTDVTEAQINSFKAALGVAAAITDYDLSVYEFNHAVGVGTLRLPL